MARNKAVDAWFERYENPMKPVVQRIRAILLSADPRLDECIKWQAPTFTYRGNLASFFPRSKQHASLMFHTGAHIPGTFRRLEGAGPTGRVLKIASLAEAEAAKTELERLAVAWCDWRDQEVVTPSSVRARSHAPKPKRPASNKANRAKARPRPAKRAKRPSR